MNNMQLALVHRSASHENNEQLEFLGDAVLQLAVTLWLIGFYPGESEGFYSQKRAALVCRDHLYKVALKIGLDKRIVLGRSEECSGGRSKPSILADAVEAYIGALFKDYGQGTAFDFICKNVIG